MLPKIYNSRMDVDPDYIPEFTDWYKRRHGPDVVSVGMYSAHGYQAVVGSPGSWQLLLDPGSGAFQCRHTIGPNGRSAVGLLIPSRSIFNHSLVI